MSNLFLKLCSATNMPSLPGDIGLLITRLFFGLSMAWAHGIGKIPPSDRWIQKVESLGFVFPEVFAWSAGLSECAGGMLIALGLCTRGAATSLLFTMCVAAFLAHADHPFSKMESSLSYGVVSLLLITLGPGRYSIDRFNSLRRS